MKRIALLASLLSAPAAIAAPTLSLPPSAARTAEDSRAIGSYSVPVAPWSNGRLETVKAEGEVTQTAWRIEDSSSTTLELLAALRGQLRQEGFEVLFECDTDECGGFDFRFATPVLQEPEMHVDLGDFRFLSARRNAGDTPDYVSLLVSRSSESAFVQMTRVGAVLKTPAPIAAASFSPERIEPTTDALSDQLVSTGRVVLGDLSFETGAKQLGEGDFASLSALANFLNSNPDKTVALVGHTDSEGSLDGNVILSRKRAQSVLDRLVSEYGVRSEQLSADGVGFLSPLASNLTPEGRMKNRRVEAMITSTR